MSSYFKQRNRTHDVRSLIKEIVSRVAKLEQKVDEIETLEFTRPVRANNDRIVYVDVGSTEVNAVTIDPNLKDFQLPLEPDGKYLTVWMNMNAVAGTTMRDASGYGNHAQVVGTITKQDGQVTDLPGRQFDVSEGGDKLRIPDAPSINTFTQTLSTGLSINFSIKPIATSLDGGKSRVIACKTDDSLTARQYGWIIWVDQNNNLYFHVRIANVLRTAAKVSAFPSLNAFYRVACTYDRGTSTPKIYINGALSTDTVSTSFMGDIALPSTTLDMIIGGTDEASASRLSAILCDFRYWREKVLLQVEIDNLQQNGYSITAIGFPARVGTATTISNEIWGDGGTGGGSGTPPPNPPPPAPPPPSVLDNFADTNFDTANFA